MNIFANTVVTMTFELFDSDGALLESTPEPITYLHGGHSGMLPKVEEALNLKKIGDAISIDVEPADAFGDYDPELVKIEPAESLPPEVEVGMQFEAFANKTTSRGAVSSSPSPTSPRARSCSTATIRGPASGCGSTAKSSTCARRRRRKSSTGMCMAITGITTDRC